MQQQASVTYLQSNLKKWDAGISGALFESRDRNEKRSWKSDESFSAASYHHGTGGDASVLQRMDGKYLSP